MLIVGERINTSRKQVSEAVVGRDAAFIQADVKLQVESGANLIDVNAGSRHDTEIDDLLWLIRVIQEVFPDARLCLDSPNPDSLSAVSGCVGHVPMFNSITGEENRFRAMAPLIQSRECDVVALCIDDRGIPANADQALDNAARLISGLEGLGVKRQRIYIDPVIQTVSTNPNAALTVLETIERGRLQFEGVHFICGLSNISFGLPKRQLLNRTFLALAMKAGLDSAIIDPLDKDLMGTLRAAAVLVGQDLWCQSYLGAFRQGIL